MGDPSSPFSLSTALGTLEGLGIMLEENISSKVLLTDGSVLCDRSQPATDEAAATGGAGFGEMEMDAGVALTAGTGGWGAGGLGARCLVDLVLGTEGWGSAGSEVSC